MSIKPSMRGVRRVLFGQWRFLSGIVMSLPLRAYFAMLLFGILHIHVWAAIPAFGYIGVILIMLTLAFIFPSRERYIGQHDVQDSFEQQS